MPKRKFHLILSVISLAVLVSSAGGCAALPKGTSPVTAPVAAATEDAVEADKNLPPVVNSFSVMPSAINAGQSAVLSWDISGARELTIAPAIDSSGSSTIAKGDVQVSPSTTTIYTVTATNDFGRITRSATVVVNSTDIDGIGDRLVGFDPVSGRNDEIDLNWEQLCLASEYQVQIAKDPGFSIIVLDTGPFPRIDPTSRGFVPADPTAPGAYFPAGGRIGVGSPFNSAVGLYGVLEAGHQYYVRFRATRAATGQIMFSPWSPVYKFTVKSGLGARTPGYGIQALSPIDKCTGCSVTETAFSWTPFKDTIKYRVQLARDAAMTQIMAQADTTTSAYSYQGTLEYGTSYYWRVMAVEPTPSDWSAVFTFHTMEAPAPATPPSPAQVVPLWAWVVVAAGSVFIIAVVVLLVMSRRRAA
ncbi:MAG: hypothetical protein FJ024_07385 [Chloroflexi bacterium]|nr:hypothetical protein [Chloroflexota bacterium]